MELLHTAEVKPEEIDHLGHMNVRLYMERGQRGKAKLLKAIGLGPDACKSMGAMLIQHDSYTRYLREQFKGATLDVRGGVVKVEPDALSIYVEVRNEAKAEVAAAFILGAALVDPATRRRLPLPAEAIAAAKARLIEIPAHGRPRSVDLATVRTDLTYDQLSARLEDDHADPMGRRMERVIQPEDCDEFGFLAETQDMMFGHLRMPRQEDAEANWGPMTYTSEAGHRFGWAAMEHRTLRLSQPRSGDVLASIGAEIGLAAKVRHSRRWIFNVTTGELVSLNDNVALALDIDARKSIEIPPEIKTGLERRHFPEFA
jgi:acyl-CoA thioester hydrolase